MFSSISALPHFIMKHPAETSFRSISIATADAEAARLPHIKRMWGVHHHLSAHSISDWYAYANTAFFSTSHHITSARGSHLEMCSQLLCCRKHSTTFNGSTGSSMCTAWDCNVGLPAVMLACMAFLAPLPVGVESHLSLLAGCMASQKGVSTAS